jgi:hypothetical protein
MQSGLSSSAAGTNGRRTGPRCVKSCWLWAAPQLRQICLKCTRHSQAYVLHASLQSRYAKCGRDINITVPHEVPIAKLSMQSTSSDSLIERGMRNMALCISCRQSGNDACGRDALARLQFPAELHHLPRHTGNVNVIEILAKCRSAEVLKNLELAAFSHISFVPWLGAREALKSASAHCTYIRFPL